MARQCSLLRRKFMDCSKISPALSLLVKHLVIGQRKKAPNFLVFSLVTTQQSDSRWSAFRSHEGSTITKKDQNELNYRIGPYHQIGPGCAGRAKLQ